MTLGVSVWEPLCAEDVLSVRLCCRLFPTELFEMFIDVGHYVRDLTAYQALQAAVSRYTVRSTDQYYTLFTSFSYMLLCYILLYAILLYSILLY